MLHLCNLPIPRRRTEGFGTSPPDSTLRAAGGTWQRREPWCRRSRGVPRRWKRKTRNTQPLPCRTGQWHHRPEKLRPQSKPSTRHRLKARATNRTPPRTFRVRASVRAHRSDARSAYCPDGLSCCRSGVILRANRRSRPSATWPGTALASSARERAIGARSGRLQRPGATVGRTTTCALWRVPRDGAVPLHAPARPRG